MTSLLNPLHPSSEYKPERRLWQDSCVWVCVCLGIWKGVQACCAMFLQSFAVQVQLGHQQGVLQKLARSQAFRKLLIWIRGFFAINCYE